MCQCAALLDKWADRMAGWRNEGATVFAFCHCSDETYSPSICRELHQCVAARATIDPLPWNVIERVNPMNYSQARLLK